MNLRSSASGIAAFVAVQVLWLVGASFAGASALGLMLPKLPGPALPFAVMVLVLPGVVGLGIAVTRGADRAAMLLRWMLAAWIAVALTVVVWVLARDGGAGPYLGVAPLLLTLAFGITSTAAWQAQAAAYRARRQ